MVEEKREHSFVEELIIQKVDIDKISENERYILTSLIELGQLSKQENISIEEWKDAMKQLAENISKMDHLYQARILEHLPPWMFFVCAEKPQRFRGLRIMLTKAIFESRKEVKRDKIIANRESLLKEFTKELMDMKKEEIRALADIRKEEIKAATSETESRPRGTFVSKFGGGGKRSVAPRQEEG